MTEQAARNREADRLYELYGKPLESEHWGEYVGIAPDGRTVIASTAVEAAVSARHAFGYGNFIFRIGERFVANIAMNGSRIVSGRFPYIPIHLTINGHGNAFDAMLDTGFDGDI